VNIHEQLEAAKRRGDLDGMSRLVPYAGFLGLVLEEVEGEVVVRLPFADHLVGNAGIPALHGGTIGSVLETAAIFHVLWAHEVRTVPKTINITVDYLRPAKTTTTFAAARVTKRGRRVSSAWVEAWQEDRSRLVATALVHLLVQTG